MTAACQARALMVDAANGSADALAALVQSTIANDRELGLPINIVLERAEVLARLAAMHGRDQDATVLAMILLASADHQADGNLANRRRAEAVAHVEIQAAGSGPTAEHAASMLNTLADQLPASVFSLARTMLGDVDKMVAGARAVETEGAE